MMLSHTYDSISLDLNLKTWVEKSIAFDISKGINRASGITAELIMKHTLFSNV